MKAGEDMIEVYKVTKGLSRVKTDLLTKSLKAKAKGYASKLKELPHCTQLHPNKHSFSDRKEIR